MSRGPIIIIIAAILFAAACSRSNPVLGDWELDSDETSQGAVLAAEAAELTTLRFASDSVDVPGIEIPVSYVVEGDLVRVVRGDGRGEHRVEVMPDGRIRVELPIGVTAVFRRAGS